MKHNKKNEPGIIIGVLLIILLIVYPFIKLGNNYGFWSFNIDKYSDILESIFAIYIGILFLLSYFFSHKSFLFRGFMWLCKNVFVPKGRGMALVFFAFTFFLGSMNLINIFLLNNKKVGGSIHYFSIIIFVVMFIMFILSIKKIKKDERGAIFRFGKFLEIRGTGFTLIIPFIDKAIKINLNDNIPNWQSLSEKELVDKVKDIALKKL